MVKTSFLVGFDMILPQDVDYYNQVCDFANNNDLFEQFKQQIDFLDTYANRPGCMYDIDKGMNTRCKLYKDFAPYSFQFVMEKTDNGKDWKFWFNGGLIYQGPTQPLDGSFPALTVSFNKNTGWSIHT